MKMIRVKKFKNKILFCKANHVVLGIEWYHSLHSGILRIDEFGKFEIFEQEEMLDCMERIKKFMIEFEKNKSDLLRICHVRNEKMKDFLKNELLWKENHPKPEGNIAYKFYDHYYDEFEKQFVSWEIREEALYKKDMIILETFKEVVESCKERFVISERWYVDSFRFYFHQKENRMICLELSKEEKYQVVLEHKITDIDIEMGRKEETKQQLLTLLEDIRKKERLNYLYEEEVTSPLFMEYMGLRHFNSEQVEKLWMELRKKYSYDELEYESFLQVNKGNKLIHEQSGKIVFGMFLSQYFSWIEKDQCFFVSNDPQELLNEMVKKQKQEWEAVLVRIEQRKEKEDGN